MIKPLSLKENVSKESKSKDMMTLIKR